MLSEYLQDRAAALVERVYRPTDSLNDLLVNLLRAAIQETRAVSGTIRSHGLAEIRVCGSCVDIIPSSVPSGILELHSQINKPAVLIANGTNGHLLAFPRPFAYQESKAYCGHACDSKCASIFYQKASIGCLALGFDDVNQGNPHTADFLAALAREIGFLLKRHDVSACAKRRLHIDALLIGASRSLHQLEEAIEKVSQVDLPVVLEAEFGCTELQVAVAIHCCSVRRSGPFVTMNCASQRPATFRGELESAQEKAEGGSLFLGSVDELDHIMQRDLLWAINTTNPRTLKRADVRIIASTTHPLDDLVKEGRFCRFLRKEIDCLRVSIPPLRSRRKDIRPLLEYELQKYQPQSPKVLSSDVLAICERYDWPENLIELERVVARLAVMTDGESIGVSELDKHVTWLTTTGWKPVANFKTSEEEQEKSLGDPEAEIIAGNEDRVDKSILELACRLVGRDYDYLSKYGIPMQRALNYVGTHFNEDISLGQLAKHSFLSPSHLSFLFKKTLGVPFKTVLATVRIEKAKQLLLNNSNQSVTEVSLDVGFGDLSHFEKTFKRIMGINPREFRRREMAG